MPDHENIKGIYTRVTPRTDTALKIKAARFGINKPEAVRLAIAAWLQDLAIHDQKPKWRDLRNDDTNSADGHI